MTKVLFIQDNMIHYRIPFFKELSEYYDIIFICAERGADTDGLNTIQTQIIKRRHSCQYATDVVKMADAYDVVVAPLSITNKSVWSLVRNKKRKYKVVVWGIGVTAGYHWMFDKPSGFRTKLMSKLFKPMIRYADGAVFYTNYPVKKYSKEGIDPKKMFVAHNTTTCLPLEIREDKKKKILFIGSLYKEKGVDELLRTYYQAYTDGTKLPDMVIIGGGEEFVNVKHWVIAHQLENSIQMKGPIYEENILRDYYSEALVCISPRQAGLSVQKSFGYGVPFVTQKEAITGGEIFDIIDGYNGVLYDKEQELCEVIKDISNNPHKYLEMGLHAKKYYDTYCTMDIMVQGMKEAIDYTLKKKE